MQIRIEGQLYSEASLLADFNSNKPISLPTLTKAELSELSMADRMKYKALARQKLSLEAKSKNQKFVLNPSLPVVLNDDEQQVSAKDFLLVRKSLLALGSSLEDIDKKIEQLRKEKANNPKALQAVNELELNARKAKALSDRFSEGRGVGAAELTGLIEGFEKIDELAELLNTQLLTSKSMNEFFIKNKLDVRFENNERKRVAKLLQVVGAEVKLDVKKLAKQAPSQISSTRGVSTLLGTGLASLVPGGDILGAIINSAVVSEHLETKGAGLLNKFQNNRAGSKIARFLAGGELPGTELENIDPTQIDPASIITDEHRKLRDEDPEAFDKELREGAIAELNEQLEALTSVSKEQAELIKKQIQGGSAVLGAPLVASLEQMVDAKVESTANAMMSPAIDAPSLSSLTAQDQENLDEIKAKKQEKFTQELAENELESDKKNTDRLIDAIKNLDNTGSSGLLGSILELALLKKLAGPLAKVLSKIPGGAKLSKLLGLTDDAAKAGTTAASGASKYLSKIPGLGKVLGVLGIGATGVAVAGAAGTGGGAVKGATSFRGFKIPAAPVEMPVAQRPGTGLVDPSKAAQGVKPVGGWARFGRMVPLIGPAYDGYEAYEDTKNNPTMSQSSKVGAVGGAVAGSWAGMEAGALAGAYLGGPLGALLGAVGGALLGTKIGKELGTQIGDSFEHLIVELDPVLQPIKTMASKVSDAFAYMTDQVSTKLIEPVFEFAGSLGKTRDKVYEFFGLERKYESKWGNKELTAKWLSSGPGLMAGKNLGLANNSLGQMTTKVGTGTPLTTAGTEPIPLTDNVTLLVKDSPITSIFNRGLGLSRMFGSGIEGKRSSGTSGVGGIRTGEASAQTAVAEPTRLPTVVTTGQVPAESISSGGTTMATPNSRFPALREEGFFEETKAMADRLGIKHVDLMKVINFESGGMNPKARNPHSSASGLIQFMESTAPELGTTIEDIRKMSAMEQLPYVEKYLRTHGVKPGTDLKGLYMSILSGHASAANKKSLWDKSTPRGAKAYEDNKGLDINRDGMVSPEEATAMVERAWKNNRGHEMMELGAQSPMSATYEAVPKVQAQSVPAPNSVEVGEVPNYSPNLIMPAQPTSEPAISPSASQTAGRDNARNPTLDDASMMLDDVGMAMVNSRVI